MGGSLPKGEEKKVGGGVGVHANSDGRSEPSLEERRTL